MSHFLGTFPLQFTFSRSSGLLLFRFLRIILGSIFESEGRTVFSPRILVLAQLSDTQVDSIKEPGGKASSF